LEAREKRRLDDLVVLQQDSNREYERRLKALQEQLTLATDRHQMEMEQKDNEWQAKLEGSVSVAKQEIREEYELKS
jgi:ribosomal silencing factor RsfS